MCSVHNVGGIQNVRDKAQPSFVVLVIGSSWAHCGAYSPQCMTGSAMLALARRGVLAAQRKTLQLRIGSGSSGATRRSRRTAQNPSTPLRESAYPSESHPKGSGHQQTQGDAKTFRCERRIVKHGVFVVFYNAQSSFTNADLMKKRLSRICPSFRRAVPVPLLFKLGEPSCFTGIEGGALLCLPTSRRRTNTFSYGFSSLLRFGYPLMAIDCLTQTHAFTHRSLVSRTAPNRIACLLTPFVSRPDFPLVITHNCLKPPTANVN